MTAAAEAGSCARRDSLGPRPGRRLLPLPSCASSRRTPMEKNGNDGGGRRHHECDDGCGGRQWRARRPSPKPRLEVILPSPALPPSRDGGGSRGAQKPVARCASAFANAATLARCTAAGVEASCGGKTKAKAEVEVEVETTKTATRTARTTLAPATSRQSKRHRPQSTCVAQGCVSSTTSLGSQGLSSALSYRASSMTARTRKDHWRRNDSHGWGRCSCCRCWGICSSPMGLG